MDTDYITLKVYGKSHKIKYSYKLWLDFKQPVRIFYFVSVITREYRNP